MSEFNVGDEIWYFCDDTDAPGLGIGLSTLRLFNGIITDISPKGVYLYAIDHKYEEILKISSCFSSKLEAISSMRIFLNELEGKS